MSTGPGWIAAPAWIPSYLGVAPAKAASSPSMLLSFERPAPAGRVASRRTASSRSLKTAQKPQKRVSPDRLHQRFRKELRGAAGRITVKIVRAHGGCLGTKSR